MKIRHYPLFDTKSVELLYSDKDMVPVKYVCTTGEEYSDFAVDVFYRETPHPVFGNKYFGLYNTKQDGQNQLMITSADWVESLSFVMVKYEGYWHYSSHRHDMLPVGVGGYIDGGRAYTRLVGNTINMVSETFVVRNGKFEKSSEPEEEFVLPNKPKPTISHAALELAL